RQLHAGGLAVLSRRHRDPGHRERGRDRQARRRDEEAIGRNRPPATFRSALHTSHSPRVLPKRRTQMNALDAERREMHRVFAATRSGPTGPVWPRTTFTHEALLKGPAAAAAVGFFPLVSTLDVAYAQTGQSFRFAWVSDTHLYPKELNTRFVDKTVRAFKEVQ